MLFKHFLDIKTFLLYVLFCNLYHKSMIEKITKQTHIYIKCNFLKTATDVCNYRKV